MQKKNLFIFNSNKRFKKYFSLTLVFYTTFYLSFILFMFFPSMFYYRSWEWFEEIVYKIPYKSIWKGHEKGDASRRYIFHFQKKWKTTVSCDKEGYRSTFMKCEKYPIAIFGDSHIWGSGLSDEETISWILSKNLNLPVFNAGRDTYAILNLITNKKISKAKILIEMIAQRHLSIYPLQKIELGEPPLRIYKPNFFNFTKIHPKRYFLFLKLFYYFDLNKFQNDKHANDLDDYLMNKKFGDIPLGNENS